MVVKKYGSNPLMLGSQLLIVEKYFTLLEYIVPVIDRDLGYLFP